MDWDGFQREMLAALGHEVFELAAAAPAGTAAVTDAAAATMIGMPPLVHAIARAAGLDVSALPALPPVEALRSPAAKRALWPRLRALRRARAQRAPG